MIVWLLACVTAPSPEPEPEPDEPCDPVDQQMDTYASERLSVDFWYRCWNGPEGDYCGWRLMIEGVETVVEAPDFAAALVEDAGVDAGECFTVERIDAMQAAWDDVRVVWQCHAVQGGCLTSWLIAWDNEEVSRDTDFAVAVAEAYAQL